MKLKKPKIPFADSKNPTRALSQAYVTAFVIIGALTLATHYVTNYITEKQRESVKVSYYISSQRTAALDIAAAAAKYSKTEEELDYDFLMGAIKQMERSHREVIRQMAGGGDQESALSLAIYKTYFKPPFSLNKPA